MHYYKKSNETGRLNEVECLPLIAAHLGIELKLTDKSNTFEFVSKENKVLVELKSRTCKKDTYSTTMIGMNKVLKSQELVGHGWKIYYFFKFTDGLYYTRYSNLLQYSVNAGFRYDRPETVCNPMSYAYIDVDLLTKIG
jgi:hypothetical protein